MGSHDNKIGAISNNDNSVVSKGIEALKKYREKLGQNFAPPAVANHPNSVFANYFANSADLSASTLK